MKAGAYCIEMGNPRHEHEWRVWETVKLPAGRKLIPGVISHSTNVVEHPELVAERLTRLAKLVGRDNLLGGTDCGFAQAPTSSGCIPRSSGPSSPRSPRARGSLRSNCGADVCGSGPSGGQLRISHSVTHLPGGSRACPGLRSCHRMTVLRVYLAPLWPRAAHVVQFGPIGIKIPCLNLRQISTIPGRDAEKPKPSRGG